MTHIHGPYPVYDRDTVTGELTDQLAPGEHYTTDEATMAAHPELEPYRVHPVPLQNVWAGDSPEALQWTVPLRFPEADTAGAVLDALAAS